MRHGLVGEQLLATDVPSGAPGRTRAHYGIVVLMRRFCQSTGNAAVHAEHDRHPRQAGASPTANRIPLAVSTTFRSPVTLSASSSPEQRRVVKPGATPHGDFIARRRRVDVGPPTPNGVDKRVEAPGQTDDVGREPV
jgi:hypothetical protein